MNVYEIVTEEIIKKLDQGVIPWRRPWGEMAEAKNFMTKKEYRGINAFLLPVLSQGQEHFATLKQVNELGGSIKSGSKGYPVVFFKWMEKENGDEFPVLRYFTVFDPSQWQGIEVPKPTHIRPFNPIEKCESIIAGMPKRPAMSFDGGERAYYRPSTDSIHLPDKGIFKSEAGYYETAFHELGHSTGHTSRLGRHKEADTEPMDFGNATYAKEELVAEMTASFLCARAGIDMDTVDNTAAYVGSWLKALKNDKRMVVMAAAQAQKAADYILDVKHEKQA